MKIRYNFLTQVIIAGSLVIIFSCSEVMAKTNIELAKKDFTAVIHHFDTFPGDPASITHRMRLWEKGIDFFGRGNEPFWNLGIDFEKGLNFTTMDGVNIETPSFVIDKAQDANVIRISGSGESGDMIITVVEETCSDTMSDEIFRYAVSADIKTRGQDENITYKGCGDYVPDYRLHDIWVLFDVNGREIDPGQYPEKGLPTFEFFVEDGKVGGHAGCNNFNGVFYRAGRNILYFEPFAMTRMMCPDMQIEDLIVSTVAGKRLKYKILDHELILKAYDGTELRFKKAD